MSDVAVTQPDRWHRCARQLVSASLARRPLRRRDPRQEPSALAAPAAICAGGDCQRVVFPDASREAHQPCTKLRWEAIEDLAKAAVGITLQPGWSGRAAWMFGLWLIICSE